MIVKQQTFNFFMNRSAGSEVPVAMIFTDSITGNNTIFRMEEMNADEIAELVTGKKPEKVVAETEQKKHE